MSEIKRYDFGWAGASKSPKMFESLHGRWVEWLDHIQTQKELEETKETLRQAKRWIESVEKFGTDTKKELEELQDALSIDTLCIEPDSMPDGAIKRAIEASRKRNKL